MENIKKIWIKEDGTLVTTHYNGSWNVIKHESIDDLDYSISIYETISAGIEQAEEELGYELSDEEYNQETAYILQYMSDSYGFELIKE